MPLPFEVEKVRLQVQLGALDLLLALGVPRPTKTEAETWSKWAHGMVSASLEHADAVAFDRWLERNAGDV